MTLVTQQVELSETSKDFLLCWMFTRVVMVLNSSWIQCSLESLFIQALVFNSFSKSQPKLTSLNWSLPKFQRRQLKVIRVILAFLIWFSLSLWTRVIFCRLKESKVITQTMCTLILIWFQLLNLSWLPIKDLTIILCLICSIMTSIRSGFQARPILPRSITRWSSISVRKFPWRRFCTILHITQRESQELSMDFRLWWKCTFKTKAKMISFLCVQHSKEVPFTRGQECSSYSNLQSEEKDLNLNLSL